MISVINSFVLSERCLIAMTRGEQARLFNFPLSNRRTRRISLSIRMIFFVIEVYLGSFHRELIKTLSSLVEVEGFVRGNIGLWKCIAIDKPQREVFTTFKEIEGWKVKKR